MCPYSARHLEGCDGGADAAGREEEEGAASVLWLSWRGKHHWHSESCIVMFDLCVWPLTEQTPSLLCRALLPTLEGQHLLKLGGSSLFDCSPFVTWKELLMRPRSLLLSSLTMSVKKQTFKSLSGRGCLIVWNHRSSTKRINCSEKRNYSQCSPKKDKKWKVWRINLIFNLYAAK